MEKNIVVIKGDGIGPEVTEQAVKVLHVIAQRFSHTFNYVYAMLGAEAIDKTGSALPAETVEVCLECDAILLGAIGHPKFDNDPNARIRPEQGLLGLRKALNLFANIRPVIPFPALHFLSPIKSKLLEGTDMVIYRELTGGIYFGTKELSTDGNSARDECIYTVMEITRIGQLAFKAAQSRRKKLTLVDKANVLETSRLWRKVIQELSKEYADVQVDYMFVDNAAMQLMINPKQFDVILTENLFGDILSDEASVLSGSLGMLPSASIGEHAAMFEPVHGSYPQAAGKDIANPVGSILSAALLLEYVGLKEEAKLVEEAVQWTLENKFVTKDIDPINFYFTSTIGDLVCDYISNNNPGVLHSDNIVLRKSTII